MVFSLHGPTKEAGKMRAVYVTLTMWSNAMRTVKATIMPKNEKIFLSSFIGVVKRA